MEYIGIDVHKKESQVCILSDESSEVHESRIPTTREKLQAVFGDKPKARILVEASTESEWVARHLEGLGHEVIVADPNFAAMYATRSRRIKTDKRDARTLADACKSGTYRKAHRLSDEKRHIRNHLHGRSALIHARTKLVSVVGALVRSRGYRIPKGQTESFVTRVDSLGLSEDVAQEVKPMLEAMKALNQQIAIYDTYLEKQVMENEVVDRLCTAPGVGPVVATAFVALLDEVSRFGDARKVASYLGLVPSEMSSGEKQKRGSITKAGNSRMRWLLAQVAHSIMRSKSPEAKNLREWAERIAARRGKSIAIIALARRMGRILFAMWRDEKVFEPRHHLTRNIDPRKVLEMVKTKPVTAYI